MNLYDRTYVSTNRIYADICSTGIATTIKIVQFEHMKNKYTSGLKKGLSILKMFKQIE
jgi:hypothetical protein